MAAKVKALQQWCKMQCDGYRDVDITNMTSSWKSGLAFCAIIHRYRPDLIDYGSLSKENVFDNNKLAFDVAERELDIPALLDAEDMVAMKVPDKLCVVTYVSQYHNYFRKFSPAGGPGLAAPRTAMKRVLPEPVQSEPPQVKKPSRDDEQKKTNQASSDTNSLKRGTLGDTCSECNKKVYIMERHLDGSKLYHRRCFRDKQRSQRSSWERQAPNDSYLPKKKPESSSNGPSLTGILNKASDKTPNSNGEVKKSDTQTSKSSNLVKSLFSPPQYVPSTSSVKTETRKSPVNSAITNHVSAASVQLAANTTAKNSSPKGSPKAVYKRAEEPMDIESKKPTRPTNFSPSQSRPTRRDMRPRATDQVKGVNGKASVLPASETVSLQPGNVPSNQASFSNAGVVNGLLQSLSKIREGQNSVPQTSAQCSISPAAVSKSNFKHSSGSSPVSTSTRTVTIKTSPQASPGSPSRSLTVVDQTLQQRAILKTSDPSLMNRTRSSSPPKSILKHGAEHTSPMDTTSSSKSSSPPRSILKHTEFSPDTKQEDAPPRSILKRGSIDSDLDSDEHGNFKPKSILKRDSLGSDPDSGPNSRVTSPCRSILKSSMSGESEDESRVGLRNESPKSILKRNSLEQLKIEFPKEEDFATSPPSRGILKTASPTRDNVTKRKSILKYKNQNEQQAEKPTVVSSKKSQENNFNAFNLSDSICLRESTPRKPIWEIEAEARQKYHSASTEKPHGRSLPDLPSTQPPKQDSSPKQIRVIKGTDAPKPEWQLEAERRQAQRGGKYDDPEKKHLLSVNKENESDSNKNVNSSNKDLIPSSVPVGGTRPKTPPTRTKATPTRAMTPPTRTEATPSIPKTPPSSVGILHTESKRRPEIKINEQHVPSGSKPAWQVEAERRQAMRNGQYTDPEKLPANQISSTPSPPPRVHKLSPVSKHTSPTLNNGYGEPIKTSPLPFYPQSDLSEMVHQKMLGQQISPQSPSRRSALSRSAAFRIPDSSCDSSPSSNSPPQTVSPQLPQSASNSGHNVMTDRSEVTLPTPTPTRYQPEFAFNQNRKKITPNVDFSFGSVDFEQLNKLDGVTASQPVAPPRGTAASRMIGRALPQPPQNVPKRRVNAEVRLSSAEIQHHLEELDQQLQIMEEEGCHLEEKIRSGSDEDMDEDELMIQWFELINQKNELVRKETDLMYRQRQQDLEDRHEELEYELRCLMQKPEREKTESDMVREEELLKDLMETVGLRNNIVDSIEEDRIRYIEEDQEIAEVLANSANPKKKKKKGKKFVKENCISREATSSPEYEVDEWSIDKENENTKKKGKKNKKGSNLA